MLADEVVRAAQVYEELHSKPPKEKSELEKWSTRMWVCHELKNFAYDHSIPDIYDQFAIIDEFMYRMMTYLDMSVTPTQRNIFDTAIETIDEIALMTISPFE